MCLAEWVRQVSVKAEGDGEKPSGRKRNTASKEVRCMNCGKAFNAALSQPRKFCSFQCSSEYRTGRPRKEVTKGSMAYDFRLGGLKWSEVADLISAYDASTACNMAKHYAQTRNKPWPITKGSSIQRRED